MTSPLTPPIVVVSGLPRSGTSMMMKMLAAGGVPVMTDAVRTADEDNPGGYYEFEAVKQLAKDASWLGEAVGKAIKIVSFHLAEVSSQYRYKVLFMRRDMAEVLASQRQMLLRNNRSADPDTDSHMAALYEKHLRRLYAWLARQDHIDTLFLDHRAALSDPRQTAQAVAVFLGGGLDEAAMTAVVDPSLYRQKAL